MQKVNKCTIALAVDSRQSLPQVSRLLPLAWGMSSTCQEQAPPGLGDVFNMSGAGCAGCQVLPLAWGMSSTCQEQAVQDVRCHSLEVTALKKS